MTAAAVVGMGMVFSMCTASLGDGLEGLNGLGSNGCRESEVPIVVAAATGDVDAVRRELDDGTEADVVDTDDNSPLACAGPRGHEAIVAVLLDRGADPDTIARDGDTVLGDAVRFCEPAVAALLLDAGAASISGRSASLLDQAARQGDRPMVEVLLEGGVDPSSFVGDADLSDLSAESTSECPTPTSDDQAAALRTLLEWRADPSAVLGSSVGLPVELNRVLVAEAIARGGDPASEAAGPVVAVAVAGRDPDMVALLLAAGADPDRDRAEAPDPDRDPQSPGATTTTLPPFELFGSILCDEPIDPMRCDVALALRQFSSTTASGAEVDGDDGRERSADLSARFRASATPLMIAAWQGDVAMVRTLLGAGADPRLVTADGHGPLHAAAAGGSAEIVQLLLAAGASSPAPGEVVAPSLIATNAGRADLAKVLQAVGR